MDVQQFICPLRIYLLHEKPSNFEHIIREQQQQQQKNNSHDSIAKN